MPRKTRRNRPRKLKGGDDDLVGAGDPVYILRAAGPGYSKSIQRVAFKRFDDAVAAAKAYTETTPGYTMQSDETITNGSGVFKDTKSNINTLIVAWKSGKKDVVELQRYILA